ncbi:MULTISPECIES: hypothetical protein [unclassified Novosphingobium]|uniref:hypothetical protein n=1 Tax=unclassified Novosphingobium TaxID=2644732 RepID=UPI00135AC05A|nr:MULTISPECIES: hypothetical protein [unclassified Novosphingobium]
MDKGMPVHAVKPLKFVFIAVELFFILITLAALADALLAENWGLGWSTFFIGFIASAWGAVAYPVFGSCWGWDRNGSS